MAGKAEHQDVQFSLPDSPLVVKLTIQFSQPPLLKVTVSGPKRKEHKEPRYAGTITHLFDELKSYIGISGLFPVSGRLIVDLYPEEDISLHIRYPAGPPPHHASTLMDRLIHNPRRAKNNKENSEKLFKVLSKRMPDFIRELKPILENDRFSHDRNKDTKRSLEIQLDKETRDAYNLLGVKPGAPWDTIKKMYHDKAREAHPDAKGGDDDGSFQKLHNAYELIKKIYKRNYK